MDILITGCNGQLGKEMQRVLNLKRTELGKIPAEFQNAVVVATDIDALDITDFNATCDYITNFTPAYGWIGHIENYII